MAWTAPTDRLTGDVITAAQWNTFLGTTGDMSMTAAAKVTTNGDMVYATAANTLARLGIGTAGQTLQVSGGIPAWVTVAAVTADVVLAGSSSAATSTTSTSAVDLVTISGLNIPVATGFQVSVNYRKLASAAQDAHLGIKFNSTTYLEANTNSGTLAEMSGVQRAEDGLAVIQVAPRSSANYLNGIWWGYQSHASSTGAVTSTMPMGSAGAMTPSALIVNATITSIVIRAINNTTSNAVEVTSIRILTGSV